jgi:hypothetical protein
MGITTGSAKGSEKFSSKYFWSNDNFLWFSEDVFGIWSRTAAATGSGRLRQLRKETALSWISPDQRR